ncbi:MAG TPA: ribosome-binding factor A [bacterium]|jgi:ribosome-binding factor A|nr:ribosome-binding factor A [bacterium]HOG38385.1 ribosome-binding factor A [bacterium]HQI03343.1 ribosome-binding factor A [bacterium]
MSKRTEQVSSELLNLISQIIEREIEIPGCFVTITNVSVTPDLKIANINFTTIPDTHENQVLKILKSNSQSIQKSLKPKIRFYTIPQLRFFIDDGDKKRRNVSEALDQIQNELKN